MTSCELFHMPPPMAACVERIASMHMKKDWVQIFVPLALKPDAKLITALESLTPTPEIEVGENYVAVNFKRSQCGTLRANELYNQIEKLHTEFTDRKVKVYFFPRWMQRAASK